MARDSKTPLCRQLAEGAFVPGGVISGECFQVLLPRVLERALNQRTAVVVRCELNGAMEPSFFFQT
jgi:hypothetical protein